MDGGGLAEAALAVARATSNFQWPQFDAEAWFQLILLIVCLILCALASASETALTSVSRIKLKNMAEEGDKKAAEIEQLLANPNVFLSTILVVNSVAVIIASSMATVLALRFSPAWGELIATILISLVVLMFCEIAPKTAAVQNPMRWARTLAGPVRGAARLLRPIVWALTAITKGLVRLMGGQSVRHGPFVTEEELRMLVTVGEEEGVLEEAETEMIHSIFEFADTPVREVMVPRIDMVALESDATVDQAVDRALEGGFSRIPVYEETIDNIIGVLYTKDMLKQLREGHNTQPIRELVRPAYFVPETKKLDDLLREIRQQRVHMVIVIDEYGSVSGLVTIEDLMEEIVGDIKDEFDKEELVYEQVGANEYIFSARISIDDFNDIMDTRLENEGYDTLGGFLYAQLDKIPVAGDAVTFENYRFTVLTTRGRRITRVQVERLLKPMQQERDHSGSLLLPEARPEKNERWGSENLEQPRQSGITK
ncbi:MAG TPA: hemolysin family protein [Ktedonobacteraceae bacterium]|jgi:putative hemolysin|nr:hemolysin family protein [Ktedonobacteraceae bacterium]